MSRSFKKTKVHAITTATSEKEDKRDANRRLRRIVKQRVYLGKEPLPILREISNIWAFAKDGKQYDADMTPKELRK